MAGNDISVIYVFEEQDCKKLKHYYAIDFPLSDIACLQIYTQRHMDSYQTSTQALVTRC